ncbi:FAD-binding oxidoreductase [Streptomyces sp. NBC_00659]|uniref:FAD-binding oxidoreductase n=1 Tax=Streptomyces sp. NBC_00659 TaxID=2903669 RepID=UPI002E30958F|nr:FAD-binding oxidoreductase [Streptomyces sp. NBC_00659]
MTEQSFTHVALPPSLTGRTVLPSDARYERVRHGYVHRGAPATVIFPESVEETAVALAYARTRGTVVSVRSGGHGISGRSTNDGGVVVDVSRLDDVAVLDRTRRRVRIGAGARWGRVAQILAPHGLAISSGDTGDVGVGGLVTAGGMGWFARRDGLTIDHVTAVEIVLADGTFVRADAEHHPDLFWAVRGAGGNFGVVTAVELEASETGDVVFANLVFDARDTASLVEEWGAVLDAAPRELTSFLTLMPAAPGRPAMAHVAAVYAGDRPDAAQRVLTPLLGLGPLLRQEAVLAPYPALMPVGGAPHHGQGLGATRSGLLDRVSTHTARSLADALVSGQVLMGQFRSVGGAVNDISPSATAYAHRTQNFQLLSATVPERVRSLDAHWARLAAEVNGMYLSFDTRRSPEVLAEAFPEPALTRLRALKTRYDPENVFDRNFPLR